MAGRMRPGGAGWGGGQGGAGWEAGLAGRMGPVRLWGGWPCCGVGGQVGRLVRWYGPRLQKMFIQPERVNVTAENAL